MSTRLTDEQKAFILEQLAAWERPSRVAELVKQTFDVSITRQQVEKYDPSKRAGKNLSRRWREHFDRAREVFSADLSNIPASHKAYRIQVLARMSDRAERAGNLRLAARLLEQIAKEVGNAFSNRRVHTGHRRDLTESRDVSQMTDEQIDAELRQLLSPHDIDKGQSRTVAA